MSLLRRSPKPPSPSVPSPPLASGPATAPAVLLARQPIVDATGACHGHELLFRAPDGTAGVSDGSRATADVLLATFADLGLETVGGGLPVWLNVPGEFLLAVDPLPLPTGRVVLEVLEDVHVDGALVDRLRALCAEGHVLALDDFVARPELDPLVDLATYVKLDVLALGLDGVAQAAEALRGRGVRLVAEKVETAEDHDACLGLGIDLFQGFFFCRPRALHGVKAPTGALDRLRSASALSGDASVEALERAIVLDPGLGLRLLRFINSAAVGLPHQVSSVRQALVLAGPRTVQQWALLVSLSDAGRTHAPALGQGLVRGRFCELLARAAGARDPDAHFMVGLFSVLDVLLETPLEAIMERLPLTDEVKEGIVHRTGRHGDVLARVIRLERGEGEADPHLGALLRDALHWTDSTLAELRAPAARPAAA